MKQLDRPSNEVSQLSNPTVTCLPEAVVVDRMVVRDPMVIDYYSIMAEDRRPSVAQDAFVIGTRALAAAGGSATMAAFDERLNLAVNAAAQVLSGLPNVVDQQIGAICRRYLGEDGEFTTQLGKDLESVSGVLDANGQVVARIREAISADVRRRVTDVLIPVTQALNVNDETGPLGLMHRSLQNVLTGQAELRESINGTVRLRAQRELSVHKGYDLESFIEMAVGELASNLGDQLDNCSRIAGLVPNSKDGDFVSLIDPLLTRGVDVRVAIEAKNRKNDTVSALCRLLQTVKENRGALVAIGVLTNPKIVTRPIALYGPDKIVVHLPGFGSLEADPENQRLLLEMAYYVARVQAVAISNSSTSESLDVGFMSDHLDHLDAAIAEFRSFNRNLGAIEAAVEKTRVCAESIRHAIKETADDLRDSLNQYAEQLKREQRAEPSAILPPARTNSNTGAT